MIMDRTPLAVEAGVPEQLVVPFTAVDAADIRSVGGKGANLGVLARAGFPVPPGFCVTTLGFRQFIAQAADRHDWYARLDGIEQGDVDQARAVAGAVRARWQELPMPAEVATEIVAAWRGLGVEHGYAVRSSATAEDLPQASFAGQQDTFLNVRGETALLEKVKACWISLFTDRAVLYRLEQGFPQREVALAVVVQRMIQPDASGILFTADPVSGARSVVSIDAGWGLGEALVGGLVTPDLYRIDKSSKRLIERRIAAKQLLIRSKAGGGVEQVQLVANQQLQPVLTDQQAVELAAVGTRIEELYGVPQDIEWAIDGGQISILQARPITSLFPVPEPRPVDGALHVYVSFGHAQVMTDAMPEMSLSLLRILVPFGRPADGRPSRYFLVAANRLFVDVSAVLRHAVLKRVVPKILMQVDPVIAQAVGKVMARPTFQQRGERANTLGVAGFAGPFLARVVRQLIWRKPEGTPAALEDWMEQYFLAAKQRLLETPAGAPRLRATGDLVRHMFLDLVLEVVPLMLAGVIAARTTEWLARDGVDHDTLTALTRGLEGNVTTGMDQAVGDLADLARASEALVELLQRDDLATAEQLRRIAEVPMGQAFCVALQQFIERYGMRGPSEIDVSRARWSEDPRSLLQAIAGNLQAEMGAHRRRFRQLVEAGNDAAVRIVLAGASGHWGFVRTLTLRRLVRVTRNMLAVREHHKWTMMRVLALAKASIVEGANDLIAQGRIEHVDEIWFLSLDELIAALEDPSLEVHSRIELRRAAFTLHRRMAPPPVMTSDGEIVLASHTSGGAPAGALIGSAVSAGVVEGIARVVLDPHTQRLNEGEILVAPFTDPGWTPLFLNAAGLVMEVGGLLTHGSVVAREYGLPAVGGVQGATTRIRSGQRIRVNGDEGYVELLDDEQARP
ncbi:MAG: phosphoenolpyruvate synthase [Herpetosiphon sp.]